MHKGTSDSSRARAGHRFSNPKQTLEELFGRIVFNILSGNTDDQARNHAAFWDGEALSLTPAYDICPQGRTGGAPKAIQRAENKAGRLFCDGFVSFPAAGEVREAGFIQILAHLFVYFHLLRRKYLGVGVPSQPEQLQKFCSPACNNVATPTNWLVTRLHRYRCADCRMGRKRRFCNARESFPRPDYH